MRKYTKIKRPKIFVIDDDPAINEALQLILEDAGYDVIVSIESIRAQSMLHQKPDVILLDIWMPGLDGRTLCKIIKTDKVTKNIPIIMVSAAREIETIAFEAGADDFITKPFEMNDLLKKIEGRLHIK